MLQKKNIHHKIIVGYISEENVSRFLRLVLSFISKKVSTQTLSLC